MQTLLFIVSIIGILNSFILIVYALSSKKGHRNANILFAIFIFMLTLRISKSIILTFSSGLHDLLITLGLSGFLAIGPSFLFFVKATINSKFKFRRKQLLHLLPAVVFTFFWVKLDAIRQNSELWHIFYRAILLHYIVYLTFTIHLISQDRLEKPFVKKQLFVISYFLLAIWMAYLLNEIAGFPYISGAVLYSVLIYFSLIIILNKGYIINLSNPKYKNTGLDAQEKNRILKELDIMLLEDKVYKSNTISLVKLARSLQTTTHILSQIINESKQQTFFELMGLYRIEESKILLLEAPPQKIADIAFEVGYNSLSAFNTAFKKLTGSTPSTYRNDKKNS